ncbi:MAG: hypothetical protein IJA69_02210 [Clostridia bacterium]|nr:hypothetical protein [Clostridia bacterium]
MTFFSSCYIVIFSVKGDNMLDGKYKFAESEKKWQDYWQENYIYKF